MKPLKKGYFVEADELSFLFLLLLGKPEIEQKEKWLKILEIIQKDE